MALKFFRIPVEGSPAIEAELNAFLSGHKVLRVARELVERETAPGWAVCVEYLEGGSAPSHNPRGKGGGNKIDYREVLSPEEFALFAKLREQRKQLAEKEGVPVYAVFTNEQLAEIAKARPQSRNALGGIAGVGEAKVERFADAVLSVLLESAAPWTARLLRMKRVAHNLGAMAANGILCRAFFAARPVNCPERASHLSDGPCPSLMRHPCFAL